MKTKSKITPQQRAAKTRAFNRECKLLYEEVTKPAHEKVEKILNRLLQIQNIRIKWVGNWKLKNGATHARLLKIEFGGLTFLVHIDGYKEDKRFSSSFWEIE
jgi:hypothetical protein